MYNSVKRVNCVYDCSGSIVNPSSRNLGARNLSSRNLSFRDLTELIR